MNARRVCIIVLDGVGIGALPDAAEFGDVGAHTLMNIYAKLGKLHIPNLLSMGLGNITDSGLPSVKTPKAAYGRMASLTKAKDTTSGHWEMMGFVMDPPFRVFEKFPEEFLYEWLQRCGHEPGFLGNCAASGTAIISALGEEHTRTGHPIVYTSADSVFQVAAHEDVLPLEKLYGMCQRAREMLVGDLFVGRVIARPFLGKPGNFTRTKNRRDFAVPPTRTVLNGLEENGLDTLGIGKIEDIFARSGVKYVNHTTNNHDGVLATIDALMHFAEASLVFTNLVDFDMKYGHRNDAVGFAGALEEFDRRLPDITDALRPGDVLVITADHGCDPTTLSTDHTREYAPVLAYGKKNANLGTRTSFADVGAFTYTYLCGKRWPTGEAFDFS